MGAMFFYAMHKVKYIQCDVKFKYLQLTDK
jgi:hypothetical protein